MLTELVENISFWAGGERHENMAHNFMITLKDLAYAEQQFRIEAILFSINCIFLFKIATSSTELLNSKSLFLDLLFPYRKLS